MNRYLQLLASNRQTDNRQFHAEDNTDGSADILLYDAIVANKEEAEWFGGVDPQGFYNTVKALDTDHIHLRINSPGGSVFGARVMEQALREHRATVTVHIDGLAASAASFLAMAGDDIVMGSGAMMMIHKAWSVALGNADDMRHAAQLLDKLDSTLTQTYARRSGQDENTIARWMAEETWFTADEATEHGFADRIFEASDTVKPVAWNLDAFLNRVNRPDDNTGHRARQQQRLKYLNTCARADH
ncbi:Clp protease ClpP [Parasalinivibrio latis]|uniref:head maturation protease, ClpP-related n=1 Tax=Parasalinivibrio latis TaxID=2952610 RepID=UPI0030DFDFE5